VADSQEPSPRPRLGRPALIDRNRIIDTALDIAATDGARSVTMSRVASELGVGMPALYYHVRNLDELLGLVAAALLEKLAVPDTALPWNQWLLEFAREMRALLLAQPVLTRVPFLAAHPTFLPAVYEHALEVMTRAGFRPDYALLMFGQYARVVTDLVHAEHARAEEAARGHHLMSYLRASAAQTPVEEIPILRSILDRWSDLPDVLPNYSDDLFEWQMALEIAGMTAVLKGRIPLTLLRERW
jgi:AcrR family transcriptional regulator